MAWVWVSRVAAGLFVVALPVFLVTTNVRFLAGEVRFYERGFRAHDADQVTGISLSELDRAATEIIDYFENDADELHIVVEQDGEEVALFNQREIDHMTDVKGLMRAIFRMNEISLAYVIAFTGAVFLWAGQGRLRRLCLLSLMGVGVGAAVVGLVGLMTLLGGFEAVWDRFHELVFTNDLWQLDPASDHLIQMFPEEYWVEQAVIVAALTIAEAMAIVIAAVACLVFVREGQAPPEPPEGPELVAVERVRGPRRAV